MSKKPEKKPAPKPVVHKVKPHYHKNPWVAAFLNFILNGLGYVYNGKRVFFGVLLIFAELGYFAINYSDFINATMGIFSKNCIIMLILALAFAYDGFVEAKKIV